MEICSLFLQTTSPSHHKKSTNKPLRNSGQLEITETRKYAIVVAAAMCPVDGLALVTSVSGTLLRWSQEQTVIGATSHAVHPRVTPFQIHNIVECRATAVAVHSKVQDRQHRSEF